MKKSELKEKGGVVPKIIGLLLAIVLVVIIVPVFQMVLGFTDPTSDPPSASGKLAASDDNLSISNARLVDLASPVDSNDAANKAYVDASSGGGNTLVTLFGVSNNSPSPAASYQPAGSLPSCLRGYASGGSCSSPSAGTSAGSGTPDCSTLDNGSTTWSQLYAGYGPMNTMFSWYNTGFAGSDETWPPDDSIAPDGGVVIGTDSICSTTHFANVDDVQMSQSQGQFYRGSSVLSACTAAGDCNTCRVCIRD